MCTALVDHRPQSIGQRCKLIKFFVLFQKLIFVQDKTWVYFLKCSFTNSPQKHDILIFNSSALPHIDVCYPSFFFLFVHFALYRVIQFVRFIFGLVIPIVQSMLNHEVAENKWLRSLRILVWINYWKLSGLKVCGQMNKSGL